MKAIITDEEKLSIRSDELDVRKKSKVVQGVVGELKNKILEDNLVGLSAIELGYPYRIFGINFNGKVRVFVNPMVTKCENLTFVRETCPSIPDKEFLMPRYGKISVCYQTAKGELKSADFVGMAATAFQHMQDHLDGILLSDIGLELDKNFDEATDEERAELIDAYREALDIKQSELENEINNDEELLQIKKAVEFEQAVKSGEVTLGDTVTVTKDIKEIAEKSDESSLS